MKNSPALHRRNAFFFLVHWVIFLGLFLGYFVHQGLGSGISPKIWLGITLLGYPVAYLLPGVIGSWLLGRFLPKGWDSVVSLVWAVLWTTVCELLLVLDLVILGKFGYHINGLVVNLLITPGGFEAMGLGPETVIPSIVGILLWVCANGFFAWRLHRKSVSGGLESRFFRGVSWGAPCACLLAVGLVVLSMFLLGVADFYGTKNLLAMNNTYPITLSMRVRSFLKGIGCKEPAREDRLFRGDDPDEGATLCYPIHPIQRVAPEKPMNILWLTAESLRADHLNPETMPNLWRLSQQGIACRQHYSGGHGTRPAMFSMFYGLYGSNWNAFLNTRRPPLFFDWLHEDGYDFLVQTSARFSYPEFDRTIFASIPQECMTEFREKEPWRRDAQGIDSILAFLEKRTDDSRPFFAFHFFEGTHAPYTFDAEQALTPDYLPEINYTTVSAADAVRVRNRQVNAAHQVDLQIGRLLAALEARPELYARTILVVTGDHGEEFYEKGRLGHNSTFVEEQIKAPLVIRIPGVEPRVVEHRSQHTDIVPTLAPFLGVQNPPSDYSVGQSLLDDNYNREFYIVCGWKLEVFVCPEYKYILPIGAGKKYYGRNLTTGQDAPCDDENAFLKKYSRMLVQANQDMRRFVRSGK